MCCYFKDWLDSLLDRSSSFVRLPVRSTSPVRPADPVQLLPTATELLHDGQAILHDNCQTLLPDNDLPDNGLLQSNLSNNFVLHNQQGCLRNAGG